MTSALQANIQQEVNLLQQPSPYIELYQLNAAAFGGGTYYFTNQLSSAGTPIVYAGLTFTAIPIMAQGFDVTSTGTAPKPTLSISNVNKTLLAAVVSLGDLVGATVIRIRTYEKFLDGQPSANTAAYIGPETWLIEQKLQHDKNIIQWSLTTALDRMGFRFGRQCLKDQSSRNLYCPGISRTRIK